MNSRRDPSLSKRFAASLPTKAYCGLLLVFGSLVLLFSRSVLPHPLLMHSHTADILSHAYQSREQARVYVCGPASHHLDF